MSNTATAGGTPLREDLEQFFVQVTEDAAIASAQCMGYGKRDHADHLAVEAMRTRLEKLPLMARVVIGEGERDQAPMLYVGEEIGTPDDGPAFDLAVDPLEGTNLCATGAPGAVAVLAASEPGGLLHAPDVYMEKIVVGPTAAGSVHLDAPVSENLRNIAKAFDRDVDDLVIVVLDRDRHEQLIRDIREAGARIRLIGDGDLSTAISAAVRGTGVHAVMGIGGAPEGVITAAAMRCLGGEIHGRLVALDEGQEQRLEQLGIEDTSRIYSTEELAPGEHIVFACTGVTDGELLRGVRFFSKGSRTSSLFMSLKQKSIRFVENIRLEELGQPVNFR